MTHRERSAIVVGGGLAGLAAACDLADAGFLVKLVEKRPFLGGRAYSYVDRASGFEVDNGQHVFLGCCTEYIAFLKRLGVWKNAHLQRRLRVRVIDKVWGESVLSTSALPAPLHLLPSLLRFKSLSVREKLLAVYAFARIRSLNRSRDPGLDRVTFEEWLQQRGQSRHSIRSLWNLIIQPTLNDDISRVSADLALMVFQEGFLRRREAANVGWAKVGLTSLLGQAARRYVEERGGEVLTGTALEGLEAEDGRVSKARLDGAEVKGDTFVIALPPAAALSVLPEVLAGDPFFARLGRIGGSPIVNVHLWYDRTVWHGDFAAFLNTPLQWAFNKSKLWGQESDGQYIDISLSGAHEWMPVPAREMIEFFGKEMEALFPAARGAEVRRALVVKQRDATFAPRPGIAALRPPQATPVPNLFLAGDWTQTGWPATMESAVRSGRLAAAAACRHADVVEGKEVITTT
jgi:squalene-associated FAD-dependent desaturase